MRTAGDGTALSLVLANLLAGCCGDDGGDPSTGPFVVQGLLTYPAVAARADAGTSTGSVTVSVTVDVPQGLCMPHTFQVTIGGAGCQLAGNIAGGSLAMSIASGQSCTLSTPTGPVTLSVSAGSVGASGRVWNIVLATPDGAVVFEGG